MRNLLDEILTMETAPGVHSCGCHCPSCSRKGTRHPSNCHCSQCRRDIFQGDSYLDEVLFELSEDVRAVPASALHPGVSALMPKQGLGFYSYREDWHRYGLPETIEALKQVARLWSQEYPNGPRIGIGDISKAGGGKSTRHKSHQIGLDVDILPMRSDSKEEGTVVRKPGYSLERTRRLIEIIQNNKVLKVKDIGFQDNRISGVSNWSGHANHLHVRFCLPPGYETRYPSLNKFSSKSRFTCPRPAFTQPSTPKGTPTSATPAYDILKQAIARGERDENKLTNLYFYSRHPELPKGYKIQNHEKTLVREWLNIRVQIVRPMLAQAGTNIRSGIPTTSSQSSLDRIMQVAAKSEIARYKWQHRRGVAPPGYIKGMALVYARVYCKLKAGDAAAMEMAKANTGNMDKDVLAHYAQEFNSAGMTNSSAGVDTLRHLFVLLIGLGMMESSGKWCVGRDRTANNTSADTAEAGLFQTSYNIRTASPLLPMLFNQYTAYPSSGFLDIFKEGGVRCKDADLENYGTGNGKEFQRLSKYCPAFAAEFAAVGLRNRRNHWGPINRKTVEIRQECDRMLIEVQKVVDQFGLCRLLGTSFP